MEIINPTWQVNRKKLMKRSRFKNKANSSSKLAVKIARKNQRNLIVKLNKEDKLSFLQNQITENTIGNYKNLFSLKKVFIVNRNLLLKLKEV